MWLLHLGGGNAGRCEKQHFPKPARLKFEQMLVYAFLLLTLVIAGIGLWLAARAHRPILWQTVLAASICSFVYLYGAWVYCSVYLKYAFALVALALVLRSMFRRRAERRPAKHPIGQAILALVFVMLCVLYFTGTAPHTGYADLRFPMKGDRYFVLQGGKGLPANIFHYNSRRAAYAMDIVKLDQWGRRCRNIFSKELSDYYIFGDTVFAPCDGIVRRAVSDNPDNIPPRRERGPHNLNGVLIESQDYTVFLGHMQHGQVFVQPGDWVKAGQPLGLAGNSGASLEPHLHIQAHSKGTDGLPWYAQPQLQLHFDGSTYLLFQEIDRR